MQLAPEKHSMLRNAPVMLVAALAALAASLLVRVLVGGDARPTVRAPAPAPVEISHDSYVAGMQARLRHNPEDTDAYAQLGLALLQRARETSDPLLYAQAETALKAALERDPNHLDALTGQGILALARHDFDAALEWAERGLAVGPHRAELLGIKADAQIELGRYEQAGATLEAMDRLRPGLPTFSRISYYRELHGDTAGAIEAMQAAVDAGVPGTEPWLWSQVQLGHLFFNSGDFDRAEAAYRLALELRGDYAHAQAGLARVQAARGDTEGAIGGYRAVVERLPYPEYIIVLGDLYAAAGQEQAATQQYDLVRAIQQLNADAGVDVDMELALFDLDHGADTEAALRRARASYQRRPSIYAADVLAWALYRTGDFAEARRYSDEARRLGTRDAALFYRAGMIAHALRDDAAARAHLEEALAINPAFSVRFAPEARALLEELGP